MPSITLASVVPSHFLNLKYCLLNFELIYPHPTTFAVALYETKNLAAALCSAGNNGGCITDQEHVSQAGSTATSGVIIRARNGYR
jgi:hypothetical protein